MSPKNPDGSHREPTSEDRSGWAKAGLEAYTQAVDGVGVDSYGGEPDVHQAHKLALTDLLGDLMHFYGDQEEFMDLVDMGARHYSDEVEDDRLEAAEVVASAEFPQTPETARTCIHRVQVWRGHECGECDAEGEYKWAHPEEQVAGGCTEPGCTP